jgi:1-phosphofructokinase family hexose kinase
VVTATSPAIDRIALVDGVVREGILKTRQFLETPGGKGTHVAMVASALGAEVELIAPVGGRSGDYFEELLSSESFKTTTVRTAAATRGTYTLVDADRCDVYEVHEPPSCVTRAEVDQLVARADAGLQAADIAVAAGGVATDSSADLHSRLVAAARGKGAVCLVDTSSPDALARALRAGADIVVPNLSEACQLVGRSPDPHADLRDLAAIACAVRAQGTGDVVLTIGRRGSLLARRSGEVLHFDAGVQGRPTNAVGCGDALLGGMVAGLLQGYELARAVALGAAAAADKLTHLHSGRVDPAAVRQGEQDVRVNEL